MADSRGNDISPRFCSTFYGLRSKKFVSLDDLHQYFLKYNADQWDEENGGSVQCQFEESYEYSLVFVHNRDLGILISYDCFDLRNKKFASSYLSVGNECKLSDVIDVGDDEFYPTGCFLEPKTAWEVVKDFFLNPTVKSSQVDWVASG